MTADTSIFATRMASDLLAVLEAMLTRQKSVVHRALTSAFYGVSLTDVKKIADKEADINDSFNSDFKTPSRTDNETSLEPTFGEPDYQLFNQTLKQADEQWEKWGVLSAHTMLSEFSVWQSVRFKLVAMSVWERLAD